MINRSSLKYALKKALPRPVFSVILFVWQRGVLHLMNTIDERRIQGFKKTTLTHLSHQGTSFSLYIDPENGFIDKHIFLYGVYEPFILDLLYTYLREKMTFVDIGANIGQHTIYAAKLVGDQGAVYAYEPIPRIYKQLLRSVSSNDITNVHAKNCAIGEKNSMEKFFVSENIGGSSLVHMDKTKETITVEIRNGDEELNQLPKVDMIKIDVEGYEYTVLKGIQKTLQKHRPILLLEYSGAFYTKNTDSHGSRILSLLNQLNYHLYDIEDSMGKVKNSEEFDKKISHERIQTNLLCMPYEI